MNVQLKSPCQHDRYDEHWYLVDRTMKHCPGGQLAPLDARIVGLEALVIETEDIPDGDGSDYVGTFYPRWACAALEQLIEERGCHKPTPYVRRPKDGDIGPEEILDALFAAALALKEPSEAP